LDRLKLLIVIPALNEEESIASIIERTLDARARILAETPVTEVELTVVSDGSTDRTVERAGVYRNQVHLIVFERNRGYGRRSGGLAAVRRRAPRLPRRRRNM
jgi:glycosyltransferase involved in cell wall biosynthesis